QGPQQGQTEANQRIIDQAPVEDWLPQYTVSDANGRETTGQVDCGSVSRPAQYSGTSLLTVLTFDLTKDAFDSGQPVSIVADRQTDPLYTVDLSDPRAPKVTGQLKIPGYSAYLHPIGDGRLLGVGQDASTSGRVKGLQVSLFDVSNVAQPTRLTQYTVKNERSEAEFDPHAFLYWAERGLVVLPVTNGLLVLAVHGSAISDAGSVSHQDAQRSLVIGDTLWTVSMRGLQANDLNTLERTAWLPS